MVWIEFEVGLCAGFGLFVRKEGAGREGYVGAADLVEYLENLQVINIPNVIEPVLYSFKEKTDPLRWAPLCILINGFSHRVATLLEGCSLDVCFRRRPRGRKKISAKTSNVALRRAIFPSLVHR